MATKMRSGKGYELTVVGMLVGEGFDVYLPTVDDQGIDAIIRIPLKPPSNKYYEVHIRGSRTWSGIRYDTSSLLPNSILILYSDEDHKILWLSFDDVQRHFPPQGAIPGDTWGDVLLNRPKVQELTETGRGDIAKLTKALGG